MKKNDEKSRKQDKEEIEKADKEDKKVLDGDNQKAFFIQRLGAYILDILLVSLVASFIATPFVDVDKYNELSNKSFEIQESYMKGETDFETFNIQYADVAYKIARNTGFLTMFTITLQILYFVVFQIYNNGQTLGKKLMKIKIVSDDGILTMNQMIYRTFLATTVLLEIMMFIFMLMGSRDVFLYGTGIVGIFVYGIIIVSCFMVMYSKDGCAIHDKLAHTRVIRI